MPNHNTVSISVHVKLKNLETRKVYREMFFDIETTEQIKQLADTAYKNWIELNTHAEALEHWYVINVKFKM